MKHTSLFVGTLLLALATAGCNAADPQSQTKENPAMTLPVTVKELIQIDQKVGGVAEALPLNTVKVHYTGWLYDPSKPDGHGKKFDSSLDHGEAFEFMLGGGQVIRGWDEGVAGMKVGGKRTLIIPQHMGYGARGAGGAIPPYATLIFDVELLDVR
ncbi:MAG TPA: FKBP-type peptidyl-prolyl cis-trans isomerase [Methylophilaceae bacterium]|nr:FKBP-type peptidyl-prolyl cis-trans isomerase [Methylophilaceae bacterium]